MRHSAHGQQASACLTVTWCLQQLAVTDRSPSAPSCPSVRWAFALVLMPQQPCACLLLLAARTVQIACPDPPRPHLDGSYRLLLLLRFFPDRLYMKTRVVRGGSRSSRCQGNLMQSAERRPGVCFVGVFRQPQLHSTLLWPVHVLTCSGETSHTASGYCFRTALSRQMQRTIKGRWLCQGPFQMES